MTKEFTHEEMMTLLHDPNISDDHKVEPLFSYTEGWIAENDVARVDDLLRDLDVEKVGPYVMIAALRGNWRAKDVLPCYLPLFRKVYDELEKRGENTKRLLRGMLNWYHEQT